MDEIDGNLVSTGRALTPPYCAFVAFEAFLHRARSESLPPRVDKPLLVDWGIAAGNESSLLTSLKALGLVDDAGRPTELYGEIRLSDPRRRAALKRCFELAYPDLPASATALDQNQLYDYFVEKRGLTGQMVDKASRFYRRLAETIGITPAPASPRLVARPTRSARVPRAPEPEPTAPLSPPLRPTSSPALPRPAPRVARRRPGRMIATTPRLDGLSVVVEVSSTASEEELTALFRRIRRAWQRSQRPE